MVFANDLVFTNGRGAPTVTTNNNSFNKNNNRDQIDSYLQY